MPLPDPVDPAWSALQNALIGAGSGALVVFANLFIAWWGKRREDKKAEADSKRVEVDSAKVAVDTALDATGKAAEEWRRIANEVRVEQQALREENVTLRKQQAVIADENKVLLVKLEVLDRRVNALTVENDRLRRGASFIASRVSPSNPDDVRTMWRIIAGDPEDGLSGGAG